MALKKNSDVSKKQKAMDRDPRIIMHEEISNVLDQLVGKKFTVYDASALVSRQLKRRGAGTKPEVIDRQVVLAIAERRRRKEAGRPVVEA